MELTDAALDIIRRFEGLRTEAYRDAAGVWTIGYGHTSAAGPPAVAAGMQISAREAETILRADARRVAAAIRPMITRPLTAEQFAALTSFAFNVGPEAFRRSSVLKSVNAGDFERVPQRLSLWVKAKGRTLPGLIRRRAAEAALFARDASPPPAEAGAARVEPRRGKPLRQSTTGLAAILSAIAGVFSAIAGAAQGEAGRLALLVAVAVIAAATAWILIERKRKAMEDGV